MWNAIVLVPLFLPTALPQWSRGNVETKKFSSESGELTLEIDPTNRSGAGLAFYEMRKRGKLLWKKSLPVALTEVVITEEGSVAGYNGFTSEFQILIIDTEGVVQRHESITRTPSRFLHASSNPVGKGIILDDDRDRFIIRTYDSDPNRGFESWWVYQFSNGKRIAELRPQLNFEVDGETRLRMRSVKSVPGIPLTLVQYWSLDRSDFSMGYFSEGVRFSLVDDEGESVWHIELPTDYTVAGDETADDELEQLVKETVAILEMSDQGFAIWFVQDQERVEFKVEQAASGEGWRVLETGRKAFIPTAQVPDESSIDERPTLSLEELKSVRLQSEVADPSPIRDIFSFAFETDGTLQFVRTEKDGGYSIVQVDLVGDAHRVIPIGPFAPQITGPSKWCLGSDGDWMRFQGGWEDGDLMHVWKIDGAGGQTTFVDRVNCSGCSTLGSVALTPDGGFLGLGSYTDDINSGNALRKFDARAALAWELSQYSSGSNYKEPENLFSPSGLVVLNDGRIASVDNIRDLIQVWWPDGTFSHHIALPALMEKEPRYPSELAWDIDSGLLMLDYGSKPNTWRFGIDGGLRQSLNLQHPDGRKLNRRTTVAPDGTLWKTDGQLLYAFGADGTMVRTVGREVRTDELSQPGSVGVSHRGLIYVQDNRTGSIHVFDSSGALVLVAKAAPEDSIEVNGISEFAIGPEGDIYVAPNGYSNDNLHFDGSGERVGMIELSANSVTFERNTDRFWGWNIDLVLSNVAGEEIRRIERRPGDRRWLMGGGKPAIAPDGSFVVLSGGLALFSAEGDPIKTIPLSSDPGMFVAFSGRWAAISQWSSAIQLVNIEDDSIYSFAPENASENSSWFTAMSPEGDELWMICSGESIMRRFRLPD